MHGVLAESEISKVKDILYQIFVGWTDYGI
jgi:hypothetical protein